MKIITYSKEFFSIWNDFVEKSKNGTFLFNRNFMDYHSDRFQDNSLMFYNESNELLAIFPANKYNNSLYSHQGLTYGGLIMSFSSKSSQIIEVFGKLIEYCKINNFENIFYKAVPYIYHKYPSDEDLYALFLNNFQLYKRDISTTISCFNKIGFSKGKKSSLSKAERNNIAVKECNNYDDFFYILTEVLKKHDAKPTHNIEEIKHLSSVFPKNIKLFGAFFEDELISGVIIFENYKTAHAQYISSNNLGREYGGVEIIMNYLINDYYKDFDFFDFGISNDPKDFLINQGLISQKEMFGGRAICHDHYVLKIKY